MLLTIWKRKLKGKGKGLVIYLEKEKQTLPCQSALDISDDVWALCLECGTVVQQKPRSASALE